MARIPVVLLTGFLGSGKTTLLNRLLGASGMARTAVVINEFGEIGIDHHLVSASHDGVVLLENGCLCCQIRGDLEATFEDLYRRMSHDGAGALDRVIIESSGLAEPSPVIQLFLSQPALAARYRVGSVVATIDAVNVEHTLSHHPESVRQAAVADCLVITKLDLLAAPSVAAMASLTERLRCLNAAARIIPVSDRRLELCSLVDYRGFDPREGGDPRTWLNADAYQHDHADLRHHHHEQTSDRAIESFCILRNDPMPRTTLELFLDALAQNLGTKLLRVKGLVCVAEQEGRPAVIQGAQQLIHTMSWLDRWPDDDHRTRIVFITEGVDREVVEDMLTLIDRMAARTLSARHRVPGT